MADYKLQWYGGAGVDVRDCNPGEDPFDMKEPVSHVSVVVIGADPGGQIVHAVAHRD